jgi:hypothetical protein
MSSIYSMIPPPGRAVLAGDLVVARCHEAWIIPKYRERLVKPI